MGQRPAGVLQISLAKDDLWILDAVDKYGDSTGLSKSEIVRRALTRYLAEVRPIGDEKTLREIRERARSAFGDNPLPIHLPGRSPFGLRGETLRAEA